MASDSWLHEFMSNPFTDPIQERGFLDTFGENEIKVDDTPAKMSINLDNLPVQSDSFSDATSEAQDLPSSSYYAGANPCFTNPEPFSTSAQGVFQSAAASLGHFKQDSFSWQQPLSSLGSDFAAESPSLFPHVKATKRPHEYSFSDDEFKAGINGISNTRQCQTHEQAVWDLNRVNICASRTGPSVAIDSILTCQRVLQQLTETILQCRDCSRTRVNLLMVVIVSIDSLINTLDTITFAESDVINRLFPEYFNPLVQDYRSESATRRYKGGSMQLRTQLEACPLIIGGFRVPPEEKFQFVKRVLQSRLSGLLGTVHRIRLCTQESLGPSARGRLDMMRGTDQRLKSVIMKLNMMARP
ncbi:hypothetical protein BJX62DRAFT_4035 [Aspergillus germanicus]